MQNFSIPALLTPFFTRSIKWLEHTIGLPPRTQEQLLGSILVITLLWAVRYTVLKLVRKKSTDIRVRYQWQKSSAYVVVGLGLIVIGRIWFEGFGLLTTYLGLVSAGIAIALKDVLTSFAGWIFLMWRRPFEVGDRIQIGEHAGDVIDIRIFQFTLNEIGNWVDADQSTGRVIHIPNGVLFSTAQVNYTRGFPYIWDEMPVLVTFESDWKKAKAILVSIVTEHAEVLTEHAEKGILEASKRFMIFYSTLSPTVYTSVKDSGINLTLRYLVEPRKRRARREILWEQILDGFAKEADIDLAYPTTRFYTQPESPRRDEPKGSSSKEPPPADAADAHPPKSDPASEKTLPE
ncbi:MAG: mechanosensitive ion channel domain-containing protein [Bacteroidota bacterium]